MNKLKAIISRYFSFMFSGSKTTSTKNSAYVLLPVKSRNQSIFK